jgi:hypothetical protein
MYSWREIAIGLKNTGLGHFLNCRQSTSNRFMEHKGVIQNEATESSKSGLPMFGDGLVRRTASGNRRGPEVALQSRLSSEALEESIEPAFQRTGPDVCCR